MKEGPKVKSDHIRRFPAHDFLQVGFTCQTTRSNNKGDIGTYKFRYMGYFVPLWVTLNEELQGHLSAFLKRTYIYVIHMTYEEIQSSSYDKQPVEKGR